MAYFNKPRLHTVYLMTSRISLSFGTLLSLALLFGTVNGHPTDHQIQPQSRTTPRANTVLPRAQFSLPTSSSVPRPKANSLKERLNALRVRSAGVNTTAPLAGILNDQAYVVNATIGGQDFALIIDTGSSDTWVPKQGFSCFNLTTGDPAPESTCAFGTDGFNTSACPTYSLIPDVNLNISYGNAEFARGSYAYENVTIGGMVVPHQQIGIVTETAFEGSGVSSGLLGLASPNLTFAFEGADPAANETKVYYNPFFYTAVQEGIVSEPYFSIALNRGSSEAVNGSLYDQGLGYLSFGGIAPVPVTNASVTVPIQGYDGVSLTPKNGTNVTYLTYTIDVETMSLTGNNQVFGTTNSTFLDSGTAVNYVPEEVAEAFHAAFDPPATFSEEYGYYLAPCNATVPEFTVKIAGTTFTVDPADNLVPLPGLVDSEGNPLCASATLSGGPPNAQGALLLGDAFLHNVVTTFDIQNKEVTITQREAY